MANGPTADSGFYRVGQHVKKNKYAWLGVLGTPTAVVMLLWFILNGYIGRLEAAENKVDSIERTLIRQTTILELMAEKQGVKVPPKDSTPTTKPAKRAKSSEPVIQEFVVPSDVDTSWFRRNDTLFIPKVKAVGDTT